MKNKSQLLQEKEKKEFLEILYKVLLEHPDWVEDIVKAINVAIKDEWI